MDNFKDTYYCFPCNTEVKKKNKNKHEKTIYHNKKGKDFNKGMKSETNKVSEGKPKNNLLRGLNVTTLITLFNDEQWNQLKKTNFNRKSCS